MIRLIVFAAFGLATVTSAQAISPPPRPQLEGLSTEVQHVGYRNRVVARGVGYRAYNRYGYGGVGPYRYRAYNRYGYAGVRPYGYRGYRYGYGGLRPFGYRGYNRYGYVGVRPYGYGVARRQVRRCVLWDAGQVCRRWY